MIVDLGAGDKCVTVDNNGECDITFDLNECGEPFMERGQARQVKAENVIGLLSNKREFLREAYLLLKPNGRFRLENPAWGCLNSFQGGMHPVEAELLLRSVGFTQVRLLSLQHVVWPWGNWIMEARK